MAASPQSPELMWRRVIWIALAGAWLFTAVSALGFDPADPPSPVVTPYNDPIANWCGRGGAVIAYYGFEMFGCVLRTSRKRLHWRSTSAALSPASRRPLLMS